MPTYVYACDNCGVQFEKFQSFKESPLQSCPECNKESIRRVFQPVGIVFKGSGWYITDSRNSSNAALSNSNTKTKETESTSSTSSDNKGSDATSTSGSDTKGSESKASDTSSSN